MKAILLLFVFSLCAFAQTAQITGVVTDGSNSAIVGVELNVTNVETGASRKTSTNETGNYTVPLLPPGMYRMTVQTEGFRSVTRENIRLEVDQVLRVDFSLEIGSISESVTVTDTTPLLQTSSGSLGQVMESKQFTDMPLNDRGALGLLALSDGVSPSRQFNPNSFSNANIFSANGSRPGQNEILLDGAPNTLPGVWPGRGILGTPVQVDAVKEFKVQTSVFSAEYGRTGGGLVNMVGRSGTNEFHGSLFHFLRNSALDANDFFNNRSGVSLGAFRRNQFGGTIGGPVVIPGLYDGRQRTFFFFNYQGTRAAEARQRIVSTPTAAMRSGDFSALTTAAGAAIRIFDPLTTTQVGNNPMRTQFPGNLIPANRINEVGARMATYYPHPNLPGNINNLSQAGAFRQVNDMIGVRVDHTLNDKNQFFVRYNRTFDDGQNPIWIDNPAQGFTALVQTVNSIGADYTLTLNPTTLMNFRYGFTDRSHDNIDPAQGLDLTTLGFPTSVNQQADIRVFPRIASTGYLAMGNDQGRNDFSYRNHAGQVSVTKVLTTHTIKFGADIRANFVDQRRGIDPSGNYSFTRNFTQGPNANVGGATVGDGIASMLLGTPGSGAFGSGINAISWNEYFAFFFQDDWKVSRKLTLNLGLRYDLEMPRYETSNMLDWFDYDVTSPLSSQVSGFREVRGGLRFAGVDGNPRRHFDTDKNNLAPRFGFAYQLDNKTVVRGGVGIFYASGSIGAGGFNIASQGFAPSTPFVGALDGLRPINTLSNPFPDGYATPEGSSLGLLSQVGLAVPRLYDRMAPLPYNLQWNFTLQREFAGIAWQAAYAASRGIHLGDGAGFEINQLRPEALEMGTALQQLVDNPFFGIITAPGILRNQQVTLGQLMRPYPQFLGLTVFNPAAGASTYHGFSVKAERRFTSGLGFLASWTTSKNISDSPATVGPGVGHQDVYNRRADRSLVEEDISQRFVASANYELPFGRGKVIGNGWNRATDLLLGGWQVNGIFTRQVGFPLAINTSPNTANAQGGRQRPNSTGISAATTGRVQDRLTSYLNPAAFSAPAPFTYGNVGRTLPDVRGPGLTNLDFSLFKTFALTEKVNLQFRAEAFNLSNSPMFGLPNQSFGAAAFGAITNTANNPRQLQFALRLFF
ncbi:MAG: TonB-dependent receptor [Bryobacterales bacterium]|nr:TonB-dependent receptor [Bryobacterales bacterium]